MSTTSDIEQLEKDINKLNKLLCEHMLETQKVYVIVDTVINKIVDDTVYPHRVICEEARNKMIQEAYKHYTKQAEAGNRDAKTVLKIMAQQTDRYQVKELNLKFVL